MHWGYPDPAKAEGTEEERLVAFRSVLTASGSASTSSCRSRSVTRRERRACSSDNRAGRDRPPPPPPRPRRRPRALARRRRRPPAVREGPAPGRRLGRLLAGVDEAPDLFITSPKVRARETAELVAAALGVRSSSTGGSAAGSTSSPLGRARAHADAERPCVVGHDPDFSELLGRALGVAMVPMRKGAIARVDVPTRRPRRRPRRPALPAAAGRRAGQVARPRASALPAGTSASASRGSAA